MKFNIINFLKNIIINKANIDKLYSLNNDLVLNIYMLTILSNIWESSFNFYVNLFYSRTNQ